MPYDPELCAEQTLDARGWFEAARLSHAALGLTIDESSSTSGGWNVAVLMAHHDGQTEILAMWEKAMKALDAHLEGLESVRRCNDPCPADGELCDLWPGHEGQHVNAAEGTEWRNRT